MHAEGTYLEIDARKLIVFALLTGLVTFAWCYKISIDEGFMYYPYYFLSSSINVMPASSIGTFGLTMAIVCLPPVALVRYKMIEDRVVGLKANKFSLFSAAFGSFGAFIVASFQAQSNIHVHLLGAGIFFAFSWFVCLSQCYLDYVTRNEAPATLAVKIGVYLRLFLAVSAMFSLGWMGIVGLRVSNSDKRRNGRESDEHSKSQQQAARSGLVVQRDCERRVQRQRTTSCAFWAGRSTRMARNSANCSK